MGEQPDHPNPAGADHGPSDEDIARLKRRAEQFETLYKFSDEALYVSEERFQSIFQSITMGIKVLGLEGNILQTNPAFQGMTGYTEAELVGRHFEELLYPPDRARTVRLFRDLITSGAPDFRLEHRMLHKDGSTLWVKTTFTVVKKGGGDDSLIFIVGLVENISEQKKIQLEVAELKTHLQSNIELERLHLARELHDGPMQELYSIIYQVEGVRKLVDASQQEKLELVRLDIEKVLGELRSIAKELRPPTLAVFGLEKAIRSYVEDLREKQPGVHLQLVLAKDQQLLSENVRLALFRILQQSLANVIRHAEASRVVVRFSYDAEEAILEITDNGKGFEIPRGWMGLVRAGHFGLAGAAERIEALGGSFSVESRLGEGTTIRARVPLSEPGS